MERERVTVAEAAKALSVSESAVRKRISRGQVEYEREEDGRLYVYLSSRDMIADNVRDELMNELRDRLAFLERELDDRKEESRRKDTIIAQLTQRIPAIEAPRQDAPESPPSPGPTPTPPVAAEGPQTVADTMGKGEVPRDPGGAQEAQGPRLTWGEKRVVGVLVAISIATGLLALAVLTP